MMKFVSKSDISPRTCIGEAYSKYVKMFAAINIAYGLISLIFSVKWGRGVLLYIKISSTKTDDDVVEYYAVAIGLLCLLLGRMAWLLLSAKHDQKLSHMTTQIWAWAMWSGFAIYYTSIVVERTAAGTVHILLSIFMLIAAAYTRLEIVNILNRETIDRAGMSFLNTRADPLPHSTK